MRLPGAEPLPACIRFDAQAGWTLGRFTLAGGPDDLPRVLCAAMLGLYKTAGADLIQEQIEAALGPPPPRFELVDQGLVVRFDQPHEVQVFYDLRGARQIVPQVLRGFPQRELATIDRQRLLFAEQEVPWNEWVATWENHGPSDR